MLLVVSKWLLRHCYDVSGAFLYGWVIFGVVQGVNNFQIFVLPGHFNVVNQLNNQYNLIFNKKSVFIAKTHTQSHFNSLIHIAYKHWCDWTMMAQKPCLWNGESVYSHWPAVNNAPVLVTRLSRPPLFHNTEDLQKSSPRRTSDESSASTAAKERLSAHRSPRKSISSYTHCLNTFTK